MKQEDTINAKMGIESSKIKEKQYRKQQRINRLKNTMKAEGAD